MIMRATGAELLHGDAGVPVSRIFTDSRQDCGGAFFVPLRGERFDGHDYIKEIADRGAIGSFTDRLIGIDVPKEFVLLKVDDTLRAYQSTASAHRDRYSVPVIAITGSCGKTSTRNLLSNVMSRMRIVRTERNENNEIGVPLTLLRMDGSTEAVVLEFGMRGPGEIKELAGIACPTHGVITNIEPTHIGRLGSLEAIADAKGELLENMPGDGTVFLNADNAWTEHLKKKTTNRVIEFGINAGDVRATGIRQTLDGVEFELVSEFGGTEVYVPLPGKGTVYNALAAAAVGLSLGISMDDIREGLGLPVDESGRMTRKKGRDGILIIDDTYNSSPASLRLALELLGSIEREGRRVAVLGDMLELGEFSEPEHGACGATAAGNAALLVTLGSDSEWIAKGAVGAGMPESSVKVYKEYDELAKDADDLFEPGDLVLVKGSRGMKMERVVDLLREKK